MAKKKVGGLKPSEAQPSGFLDGQEVKLAKHRFVLYDYDGKVDPPAFGLMVTMETEDGEERDQFYSGGNGFEPENGGKQCVPTGSKDAIAEGTKANKYIIGMCEALAEKGISEDILEDGDISHFDGIVAVMETKANKSKNQPEGTVLVPSEIKELPRELDGDAPDAPAPESEEEEEEEEESEGAGAEYDDDFAGEVIEFIENKLPIQKDDLPAAVNKKFKKKNEKSMALAMVTDEKFLDDEIYDVPWQYDGDELKDK